MLETVLEIQLGIFFKHIGRSNFRKKSLRFSKINIVHLIFGDIYLCDFIILYMLIII